MGLKTRAVVARYPLAFRPGSACALRPVEWGRDGVLSDRWLQPGCACGGRNRRTRPAAAAHGRGALDRARRARRGGQRVGDDQPDGPQHLGKPRGEGAARVSAVVSVVLVVAKRRTCAHRSATKASNRDWGAPSGAVSRMMMADGRRHFSVQEGEHMDFIYADKISCAGQTNPREAIACREL